MKHSFLNINRLGEEPYSGIVGFPNGSRAQVKRRIAQMSKLGIQKIAFVGCTRILNQDILGKGYSGIVLLGRMNDIKVAVKIRRLDSRRRNMNNESKLLQLVNNVGVGPRFIASSSDILVMEYTSGKRISDWLEDSTNINRHLKKILTDCFKLDMARVDHGELSRISRHVIIGRKTTLMDFESASSNRHPSNVTSATQGLFIVPRIAQKIKKYRKVPRRDVLIKALRAYKKDMSRVQFNKLLKVLDL